MPSASNGLPSAGPFKILPFDKSTRLFHERENEVGRRNRKITPLTFDYLFSDEIRSMTRCFHAILAILKRLFALPEQFYLHPIEDDTKEKKIYRWTDSTTTKTKS